MAQSGLLFAPVFVKKPKLTRHGKFVLPTKPTASES
jgi:hypothetical protein